MALIIDLKPEEKILIGSAVLTNDKQRTRLHISGDTPILREKDVMQEDDAVTPCKKVYFLIQCMYLARNPREYHPKYFELLRMIQSAVPSTALYFARINSNIVEGHYYKALREARDLISHEEEILAASGVDISNPQ
ncbi:MAG TPA: flagellar biosynthesis repressor FlbT [Alphaproteobacteria bacterium]|nr:flagellar biosynthesis repressor FlbT [Alphaproteobacteria bacterium]HOO49810.1 flagellar biosynthesis repressor FlbT [Alphaproteobacteria bacterium]